MSLTLLDVDAAGFAFKFMIAGCGCGMENEGRAGEEWLARLAADEGRGKVDEDGRLEREVGKVDVAGTGLQLQ